MREFLLADEPAENVVLLLELFPERQKTRVDFALTQQLWGIAPVCLTQVRKRGRELFYEKDGRLVRIKRLYNRIIFDELARYPGLETEFHLTDADVDVTLGGPSELVFPRQQVHAAAAEWALRAAQLLPARAAGVSGRP